MRATRREASEEVGAGRENAGAIRHAGSFEWRVRGAESRLDGPCAVRPTLRERRPPTRISQDASTHESSAPPKHEMDTPISPAPRAPWRPFVEALLAFSAIVLIAVGTLAYLAFRARQNVDEHLAAIRARGEPTRVSEIRLDDVVPTPGHEQRAAEFLEAYDAACDLTDDSVLTPKHVANVAKSERHAVAASALAAFAECTNARGGTTDEADLGASWWTVSLERALDPALVLTLDECDRRGVEALRAFHEPLVPMARAVCEDTSDERQKSFAKWRGIEDGLPGEVPVRGRFWALSLVRGTIPGLLQRGDTAEAVARLETMTRGVEHARDSASLQAHAEWLVGAQMVVTGCRAVLATPGSRVDLGRILAITSRWNVRDEYERALVGERAVGLSFFDAVFSAGGATGWGLDVPWFERFTFGWWRARDEGHYLDRFDDVLRKIRAGDTAITCPPKSLDPSAEDRPSGAIVSELLLPRFSHTWQLGLTVRAHLALLRLAATADAAAPEADLVDPYDGHPLRSRRESDQVVWWSVGHDRVDGHGDAREVQFGTGGRSELYPADIVWIVRRR